MSWGSSSLDPGELLAVKLWINPRFVAPQPLPLVLVVIRWTVEGR